ncbi:MAG: hypothetical protein ACT4PW_00650 [Acidimicrobiia bacterium]
MSAAGTGPSLDPFDPLHRDASLQAPPSRSRQPQTRDDEPLLWVERYAPLLTAQVAVGGLCLAGWPQHATSIAKLTLASLGVAAAVIAVQRWWIVWRDDAPAAIEKPPERALVRPDPPGLISARTGVLAIGRVRKDVLPMGVPTLNRLREMARGVLRRRGVEGPDPLKSAEAQELLSPETYRTLTTDPFDLARAETFKPTPEDVAEAVHAMLDELQILDGARDVKGYQ